MKILIVEDDALMLRALEHSLLGAGYTVVSAQDGMKGLEIFNLTKDFDLIISDIMMPNVSGFTLLSTIREFHERYIPVILISSLDKAQAISTTLELEADDIIVKPIDFKDLIDKVRHLTEKKNRIKS